MNNSRSWLMVSAGLFGATAVALGAYHAHGMEKTFASMGLDAETVAYRMQLCETGLKYQLVHAASLLAMACAVHVKPSAWWKLAGGLMALGMLLFAGSLYAIAATGIGKFGAIAPIGGLSLILAWTVVAIIGMSRANTTA